MWSRAGRARLFSAFLRLLPPRAGIGGSSSAMRLGLIPGLLGTAVPTVAVWTGSPFGFPLEEIQKLVHSYLSELQTEKSSFTVFRLSAPYLFWVICGPLWGGGCQIGGTLCRLQKHFLASQTRSDIQLWTKKRGLKYLFLSLWQSRTCIWLASILPEEQTVTQAEETILPPLWTAAASHITQQQLLSVSVHGSAQFRQTHTLKMSGKNNVRAFRRGVGFKNCAKLNSLCLHYAFITVQSISFPMKV